LRTVLETGLLRAAAAADFELGSPLPPLDPTTTHSHPLLHSKFAVPKRELGSEDQKALRVASSGLRPLSGSDVFTVVRAFYKNPESLLVMCGV
jgi:hypothetical protein